tara:strand:- start:204 stop:551 length:348 start_codon:yes stop_codon:yes gene_type:complete
MSKAIAFMKDAIMSLNSDIIAVKHDASTDTYTAYGEGETVISFDASAAQTKQQQLLAEDGPKDLRAERNHRLSETDWWASSDLTMTQAQIDYRQALRDITDSATSLDDVTWPEKP